MRQLLVSIVVLLCLSTVAFAAPKKKKATPESKVTIDLGSCVDKAIDYRALMVTNPYDNIGKCYWLGFPMVKTQLLSRSIALIGFASAQQNVFALMDFGKESVPMGPITGLVMGLGAYEYETVSGSVNTVHHLKKLDGYLKRTKSQQREKADRDMKETEIRQKKAKDLEEALQQEADRIAKVSTYVDEKTGLMWTKDANIAGLMTWHAAVEYIDIINSNNYMGFSDWRLPTQKDLDNIYNCLLPNSPVINEFINVNAGNYWTSDVVPRYGEVMVVMKLKTGRVISNSRKVDNNFLWPVRTNSPAL